MAIKLKLTSGERKTELRSCWGQFVSVVTSEILFAERAAKSCKAFIVGERKSLSKTNAENINLKIPKNSFSSNFQSLWLQLGRFMNAANKIHEQSEIQSLHSMLFVEKKRVKPNIGCFENKH